MFVKDYISTDYPIFSRDNAITDAAEIAAEFGYSHIFINNDELYTGALSKDFLEEKNGTIENLRIYFERFAILEDAHLLDSIKLFHAFHCNVVPVISKTEKYLGYISFNDVVGEFSKYPLFSESGAVITVEISGRHYSFTEISKIIETNNTKIYGCYISSALEGSVQITLKISSENLSSIYETFERYGYTVVHKHYNDEKENLIRDRFGFFQKYLQY